MSSKYVIAAAAPAAAIHLRPASRDHERLHPPRVQLSMNCWRADSTRPVTEAGARSAPTQAPAYRLKRASAEGRLRRSLARGELMLRSCVMQALEVAAGPDGRSIARPVD